MKMYVNVMELLIEHEIITRLNAEPDDHLKREVVSLMAYALNRVPPLYACSIQGIKAQIKRAKNDYQSHIENAVRWSFSAVKQTQRNPSAGLTRDVYQQILKETRQARKTGELSPIDLPELIDSMLPEDESEPTQGQATEPLNQPLNQQPLNELAA